MRPNRAVVDALDKTAKTHRQTFKHAYSDDPEWAEWYARYLLDETDFASVVSRNWTPDELAEALKDLDSAFTTLQPNDHWSTYYAKRLIE